MAAALSDAPVKRNTAERVTAALAAYVRLGSVPKASDETGVAQSTLYAWLKEYAGELREIQEAASRARVDLVAAEAVAITQGLQDARPGIEAIARDPSADPRVRVQAFVALGQIARQLDGQARLDRGEPTAIDGAAPDADAMERELAATMRELERRGLVKSEGGK